MKLISHVKGDNDLIESWLRHYIQLGVDRFHLVLHGSAAENWKLCSIKANYPITIEGIYEGPFRSEEKKSRLDAILAQCNEEWIVLVDSDEFVEFPYPDISETIRALSRASANVMCAPMLQRITLDGSLETPPVIDQPFEMFPLCSIDLYRRMGMKSDTFKFPLFYCRTGTRMFEEGNHHPPVGYEPRMSTIRGVTHHFKFRRTVSERLDRMIQSEHPWRHESVQFREYLDMHAGRLPLDGSFFYSREELFRRRLLQHAPTSPAPHLREGVENGLEETPPLQRKDAVVASGPRSAMKKIMFVLPKTSEFGGMEKHLLTFLRGVNGEVRNPVILCLGEPVLANFMDGDLRAKTDVKCVSEPKSLWDWIRLFRGRRPDVVVFCYNWFKAFSWQGPFAGMLAGVRRRISIQHLVPLPPPPPVTGRSPRDKLRRLVGERARTMLKIRLTGYVSHKTVCVSNAVRDSLVQSYQFPVRKTITIHNGISTTFFTPHAELPVAVRAQFEVDDECFLLICAARLTEVKGVDIVIHAVSRVVRQGVSCKCIILGEGPLKEKLRREANSLGMSGYIFFEGFRKDVRPYLQSGSAFILTSYVEGLPLSVLEAMACGLPCIVTNVGGNVEAVNDHVNGLVISPGSLEEAEEAILFLATHRRECAEMGIRARETACRSFGVDNMIKELSAVILT